MQSKHVHLQFQKVSQHPRRIKFIAWKWKMDKYETRQIIYGKLFAYEVPSRGDVTPSSQHVRKTWAIFFSSLNSYTKFELCYLKFSISFCFHLIFFSLLCLDIIFYLFHRCTRPPMLHTKTPTVYSNSQ